MEYTKACKTCEKLTFYKSAERLKIAIKNNRQCVSCAVKKSHSKDPMRFVGLNNPMFGTCAQKIWKSKFSKIEVDEKMKVTSHKKSSSHLGSKNFMFGKPSPKGSGYGISGSYKGTHFRSLLELCFLKKFFDEHKYVPKTAESNLFVVPLPSGSNYFPDFVDDDGIVYEIKPLRLLKSNEHKIQAGLQKYGLNFKVITEHDLPNYKTIEKDVKNFQDLVLSRKNKGILRFWPD